MYRNTKPLFIPIRFPLLFFSKNPPLNSPSPEKHLLKSKKEPPFPLRFSSYFIFTSSLDRIPTETTEVNETELSAAPPSGEGEHPLPAAPTSTATVNLESYSTTEAGSLAPTEGGAAVPAASKAKKRRNSKKDATHQESKGGKGKNSKPAPSRTQPGQTWAQVVVPARSAARSAQATHNATAPTPTTTPITPTTNNASQTAPTPATPATTSN